jgi:hypothetical protein
LVHDEAPADEYVPAVQSRHDEAPTAEYLPAAQLMQVVIFPWGLEKVPAAQLVQFVRLWAPSKEVFPAGQKEQPEIVSL